MYYFGGVLLCVVGVVIVDLILEFVGCGVVVDEIVVYEM